AVGEDHKKIVDSLGVIVPLVLVGQGGLIDQRTCEEQDLAPGPCLVEMGFQDRGVSGLVLIAEKNVLGLCLHLPVAVSSSRRLDVKVIGWVGVPFLERLQESVA